MSIPTRNSAETSHYLGIDFGKTRIGLALADSETKIAFAYGTLKNDKNFLRSLAEIIKKEKVEKVIIGVPVFLKHKEMEQEIKKWGEMIKDALAVEVGYQDEMFTTKMAEEKLKEKGARKIKECNDREAARIILQEWLDRH